MSWDLHFLPPGKDLDWLDTNEASGVAPDMAAAMADAIRREYRHLMLSPNPDGSISMEPGSVDDALLVLIELNGHHASIQVPYWEMGSQAAALADSVANIARILHEEAGLVPVDPQEDRRLGIDEVRTAFLRGHAEGVAMAQRLIADESAGDPWWKNPRSGVGLMVALLVAAVVREVLQSI